MPASPGWHLPDLRYRAHTLTAATGAGTPGLTARTGHASTRTAMIYQHATHDRDDAITEALDELIVGAFKRDHGRRSSQ